VPFHVGVHKTFVYEVQLLCTVAKRGSNVKRVGLLSVRLLYSWNYRRICKRIGAWVGGSLIHCEFFSVSELLESRRSSQWKFIVQSIVVCLNAWS